MKQKIIASIFFIALLVLLIVLLGGPTLTGNVVQEVPNVLAKTLAYNKLIFGLQAYFLVLLYTLLLFRKTHHNA